ncbi:hypothetical protein HB939_01820 [Listeria welshimeri]|nr:hypothetical protein [Listeria welshimeri]MBC1949564.1 hypothetical protein [Listeria welshimeri]
MISDKQYKGLSDSVYWLDPKHGDYAPEMRKWSEFNYKGETYKILRTENISKNGIQAMAVAPINKHGKVGTTEVVIAYAGTNFSDTIVKIVNVVTEYIFQIKRNNILKYSAWLLLIVNI